MHRKGIFCLLAVLFCLLFCLPAVAGQVDTLPPVIYGVGDIVVKAGHHYDFSTGIFVSDDSGFAKVTPMSDADFLVPGSYSVAYKASDANGNFASAIANVTVEDGWDAVEESTIYALADTVLSAILVEGMSDEEKCLAIYQYLHAIPYTGREYSKDFLQSAYCFLTYREGDCYGYYAASRLLLERLGYDVLKVENANGFTHVWCLVSLDGGLSWKHFDPTSWRWGETFPLCLLSDQELTDYGTAHPAAPGLASHDWNRSQYPQAR